MKRSYLEKAFIQMLKDEKIPLPDLEEHTFCKSRKWRFDFAYSDIKVAIEIEGGVNKWGRQGGHTKFDGFLKDVDKYNRACIEGWRLLRYTKFNMPDAIKDLKKILR